MDWISDNTFSLSHRKDEENYYFRVKNTKQKNSVCGKRKLNCMTTGTQKFIANVAFTSHKKRTGKAFLMGTFFFKFLFKVSC